MSLIRGMAERWSMHRGPCHVRFLAPRSTSLKPCPTTNVRRECLPSVSCCTRFHARIAGVRSPLPSWAECLLSFHRRNASFAIRIRSTMPLVLDKVYFRLVGGYWTVEGCLWWNFVRVGQMLQQLKRTFCKFHLINFNGRFCGDKWLISVSLFIMKKAT